LIKKIYHYNYENSNVNWSFFIITYIKVIFTLILQKGIILLVEEVVFNVSTKYINSIKRINMELEIKKLTPDLVEQYLHFFDVTPHDTNRDEDKCYCAYWSSANSSGKDFSNALSRRNIAKQYVQEGHIQGYLAFLNGEIVGWCNTNTKKNCVNCEGWKYLATFVENEDNNLKGKSIFCFVVKPELRRQKIATKLLMKIIEDAKQEGYDYLEAYPYVETLGFASDFGGYVSMYQQFGFEIYANIDGKVVMRKYLK